MSDSPNSEVDIDYIEKANVVVRNVSKRYVISQSRSDDANTVRAGRNKIVVDALSDVSFVTVPGESVGLIGLNGSGKSTLLKLIAGGESPTSGDIFVRYQPMLMGVSPALQKNLSGESNIYLGCLALGMSPDEAREQIPIIAEWTELGEAIKRPMSTYSSGMGARLGFAISTAVNPEILLIDEALSTGDAAFGAKAQERMTDLLGRAGNLFLVSHSIGQIEKNCKRTIWINQGRIISDGLTDEVSPTYHEWARLMGKKDKTPAHEYLESIVANYQAPQIVFE
ncbi:ABC transporter ATP-binding protein [Corynebacterium casei]|uniref:ABC transporter ATP-binding protein n=1 Tax=Corynebacterium casei TaxID=160386 RepID=UPI003FD3D96E